MKKTIFINGINGFIGSNLIKNLIKVNDLNFILSSNKDPSINILQIIKKNKNIKFVKSNLLDLESVYETVIRSDHIIHLAGIVGNNKSSKNIKKTFDINVLGSLNIFKATSDLNKPVTFLSLPNLNDFSSYALSKSCSDRFAQMYLEYRNLDISILRLFNCYGPEQDISSGKLIINLINKSLKDENIFIYGTGKQKFNFIYIEDAVRCIVKSVLNHKKGIYYIGSNDEISVNEISKKIINLSNSKSKINYKPARVGELEKDQVLENKTDRINIDTYFHIDKALKTMIDSVKYK